MRVVQASESTKSVASQDMPIKKLLNISQEHRELALRPKSSGFRSDIQIIIVSSSFPSFIEIADMFEVHETIIFIFGHLIISV